MDNMFSVFVAEKPYQDSELGDAWRTHRFLMLADMTQNHFLSASSDNYIPEQELHYVKMRRTPFLKAVVYPKGRIVRPKSDISVSQAIAFGSEYEVRGNWNRALATALASNYEDINFADVTKVTDVNQLYTCDAGLQAGLDAMEIQHDFGRAGFFNSDLYNRVAEQVPTLDPSDTLSDRRRDSERLMKEIMRTRKAMQSAMPKVV